MRGLRRNTYQQVRVAANQLIAGADTGFAKVGHESPGPHSQPAPLSGRAPGGLEPSTTVAVFPAPSALLQPSGTSSGLRPGTRRTSRLSTLPAFAVLDTSVGD